MSSVDKGLCWCGEECFEIPAGSCWCEEIKQLQKRIEELESVWRCEHCGSDKIYSGPPDCPDCGAPNCCQTCCKIATQEMRIEEMEETDRKLRHELCDLREGHRITDEQIDKAWEEAHRDPIRVWDVFDLLGIVRCPDVPDGCGGTGMTLGDTCPDCDGNGWVIGGEDEQTTS